MLHLVDPVHQGARRHGRPLVRLSPTRMTGRRSNKLAPYAGDLPGGNGVVDSPFACRAGCPGSIPAIGKFGSSCNIKMIFLPLDLRWLVMGQDTIIGVI